jgi:hypothetical protein
MINGRRNGAKLILTAHLSIVGESHKRFEFDKVQQQQQLNASDD